MTEEEKKELCVKAISLQEAINAMQALQDEDIETYGVHIPECFDGERAIEALKQLKPVRRAEKAEQEPKTNVLDKIIAEIEQKGFNSPLMNPVFAMTEIIEIIDKYRK